MDDDGALVEKYTSRVDALPSERASFLTGVIEDGQGTWEGAIPPFDRVSPVEYEGDYYRIDYEIVDTRIETQYAIDVDYDPEHPVDGPTIAADELPPEDRTALEGLIPPPEGHETGEGYDRGRSHRYPSDAESVLVPDQQYDAVTSRGSAYPIQVEQSREVDVHTYRYTAEQIATDASELAAMTRERYRFTLADLSSEERDIVETAIEEEYTVYYDEEMPDAFQSLIDRIRAHGAVQRDDYGGEWLVHYEDTDYWVDLQYPTYPTATVG